MHVYARGGGRMERSKKEERGRGEEGGKKKEEVGGEGGKIRRQRKLRKEEAERKLEKKRRKRERNVIWRGLEGEDGEKRLWLVEEIVIRTRRREMGIRGWRGGGRGKMDFNYGNGEGERIV